MKKCWNQSREREREKDSSFYLHRHQKLSLLRGSLWYLLVIFSFTGHMHLWRETDPKGLSCPLWKLKSLQLKLNFCPLCKTLALNDTFYLISTCWGMPPFWQTAPRVIDTVLQFKYNFHRPSFVFQVSIWWSNQDQKRFLSVTTDFLLDLSLTCQIALVILAETGTKRWSWSSHFSSLGPHRHVPSSKIHCTLKSLSEGAGKRASQCLLSTSIRT